jgi:hypothetical protein
MSRLIRLARLLAARLALPLLVLLGGVAGYGADKLNWETRQNRVSADIKSADLRQLLAQLASATGWQVYVEPELQHKVSAKFRDLPPGEALHLLLGDLSFALVPETNRQPRLLVFRTTAQGATQLVPPAAKPAAPQGKVIPDELIVRLKPGAQIEDVARLLGAKVIGRIDGLNAYRLQFEDGKAADAAREQLAANPEVASVESNYSIESPPAPGRLGATTLPPPQLRLKPPPDNGRIIIGLVDTAVQPLGNGLDAFLLKQVSVAGAANPDPSIPSHGTSMAETMLRSLQAMTKGDTSVQILPVDVYGSSPDTSTFDLASGISQAVNGGAKIINLSLGSEGDSSFLHSVIQDAQAKNVVFIGAAGNSGGTAPFYPAAYPEVDAVTALDQGRLAPYANRGNWVSFGAPGTSIIYYNNQPWSVVGTSASAAYLSGAISGYMDATHSSLDKAQSFIRNNFGVTVTPPK